MQNYVVGFLFNSLLDSVVLIEKQRPSWQKGRLNGVGGHVEPGESSLNAMKREFMEETGVEVNNWEHFTTLHCKDCCIDFYRAESNNIGDVKSVTDEKVFIYDVKELYYRENTDKFVSNVFWLIPLAMPSSRHDWVLTIYENNSNG